MSQLHLPAPLAAVVAIFHNDSLRRVLLAFMGFSVAEWLLRRIPIFAPLGGPAVERLAARLVPVHAHPGSVVIRQGDPGDHFYIVVSGRVAISVDGRRVRDEGPGESFGEIALLREVLRTATVEALEGTELLALERRTFLEAITGQPASAETAEQVVRERLGVREEEADASA